MYLLLPFGLLAIVLLILASVILEMRSERTDWLGFPRSELPRSHVGKPVSGVIYDWKEEGQ